MANSDCHDSAVVQLKCVDTIKSCFGFLCDQNSRPWVVASRQKEPSLGYAFFKCLPSGWEKQGQGNNDGIVVQVYMGLRRLNDPFLFVNDRFANANGFSDGDQVFLVPLTKTSCCTTIEVFPKTNQDWMAFASFASQIEEVFLGQVRLVRSGMNFLIFLESGRKAIKFVVNVPGALKQQNFLLSMDTRVVVLPGQSDDEENVDNDAKQDERGIHGNFQSHNAEAIRMSLNGGPDIQVLLWPETGQCFFRVLPCHLLPLPIHEQNIMDSFNSRGKAIQDLLKSLPILFIATTETIGCQGWTSLKKHIVKVGVEVQQVAALLMEVHALNGENQTITLPERRLLDNLADLFASANLPALLHCWPSPGLQKAMGGIPEFSWLSLSPIDLAQLQECSRILVQTSSVDADKVRPLLEGLLAASAHLRLPWLIPANGICLPIGRVEASPKLNNGQQQTSETSHNFFWPLSPNVQIEVVKQDGESGCEEDAGICGPSEEGLPMELMQVPGQEELVANLRESLCAAIKQRLVYSRNKKIQQQQCIMANQMLAGPPGSGKTTILARLKANLRQAKPIVASELMDCAGKSPAELSKELRDALTRLGAKWPSALLLDNFHTFASQLATNAEGDERNGRLQLRKVYQSLFKVLLSVPNVPVVCAFEEGQEMLEEVLSWEGIAFFTGKHQIEEFGKESQLSLLGQMLAPFDVQRDHLEPIKHQLNSPTISHLIRLAERISLCQKDSNAQQLQEIILGTTKIGQKTSIDEEPSSRIGFDQIAGLTMAKQLLTEVFIWPSKYPELFAHAGGQVSKCAILYGPSGCGKTLLTRALPEEMNNGVNVLFVKGPELYSKYIGQSEQNVRQLFAKARSNRPSLIVFDEFSAPQRGTDNAHVTDRIVNQLLTELDGFEGDSEDIFVIAATNRLDLVDRALLRPGRFEHQIFVGKPNLDERLALLRLYTGTGTEILLSDNVNLRLIAERTEGLSGAEMRAIVQNALHRVEKENMADGGMVMEERICQKHLQREAEAIVGKLHKKDDDHSGANADNKNAGQKICFN